MLKIFKNKRNLKYVILSILIITVLLLSTIMLTIVNNLTEDNNTVQIAKATEEYSYSNPYIPNGFTKVGNETWNTGYVIKETSTGNEFVWVPVYTSNILARREFTKTFSSMSSSSDTQNSSFVLSVNKYGGFYVGRYEAGIGSTSGNNIGVPVCKSGVTVWRNISRNNAASSAQKMYETNEELISSLMNSDAYDTMLNWLQSTKNVSTDSRSWGNYRDNANSDGTIKSAGYNSTWKANNIYDIAGNVWEWTTENYGNDAVVRGGDALSSGSILPAGTRDHASPTSTFDYAGFRVLLYRDVNFVDKPKVLAITCGANQTAYLNSDNMLWTWGKNLFGELGDGTTTTKKIPTYINSTIKFKDIKIGHGQLDTNATKNTSLSSFAVAIDTNGKLYTWGSNSYGQLGNGSSSTTAKVTVPTQISINKKIDKISAGRNHCIALDENGKLWAWGHGTTKQLGNGLTKDLTVPTQITISNNPTFTEISTFYNSSFAIDTQGNLWTWGSNSQGQLGIGKKSTSENPSRVSLPNGRKFQKVSIGYYHSIAIDDQGQLYTWGSNTAGQLGNGNTNSVYNPTLISLPNNKKCIDISAGGNFSMALDIDGNLWTWGYNSYGQLGNNSTVNASTPQLILTKIQKISAGIYHFIAVDEEGTVFTCGRNQQGQLGNNSTTNSTTPVKITINN